ncbi:hypothetical protein N8K70_03810 [Microbacterium betulae]|uniref:Uncharacterized protein n=1 Tax=Microbacterium betulae TaxID=2981139 RepID=A0AA97FIH2_9MICO|nr:hypothetical protein [Microbacterium sp. AB]WOF23816.1 hypothetical protein N8K70_03810 [Microbacterium sp. AB]
MRADKRRAGRAIRKRRRQERLITGIALDAGIELMPWQLAWATIALSGTEVYVGRGVYVSPGGHRSGKAAVVRLARGARPTIVLQDEAVNLSSSDRTRIANALGWS